MVTLSTPSAGVRTHHPRGVSFVIPVFNGAQWIEEVIDAIRAQRRTGPLEIIAVDDGSTDDSLEILQRRADRGHVVLSVGPRRGAAAAINHGIWRASQPFIAQVDQDVVLGTDWLEVLLTALDDPEVAAAQGHYVAAADAGPWSRVMALDLRQRYRQLGQRTNHVCTGNSVYRKAALVEAGLFDETLGYGYDNDMSYRLSQAGFKLAFRAEATSTHRWSEGMRAYARQQYGFGYGRLDLLAKHRNRIAGDDVSPLAMMLHGPLMAAAAELLVGGIALFLLGLRGDLLILVALLLIAGLAIERFIAGVRAIWQTRDPAGLWFAPVHLVRDAAWTAAIVIWGFRRLRGLTPRPSDSMARDVNLEERSRAKGAR